jgi:hypothetical protein
VAEKIKTALPPDLDLDGSWIIEWDAVDPVSGDSVSGVVISATALQVAGNINPGQPTLVPGPYMLVPGPNA